jgi:hypothetical protein
MTTWPVNWIEQDQIYRLLQEEYEKRLAQATPVLVHSFNEPTQEQWEDAYVKQTGRIPPILPGKLRWFDLRNGTIKSYTTIYKDGGINIDPTVRPLAAHENEWGCIRLLGVTRNVYTIGFPNDVTSYINKGLLMLIIHYPSSYTAQESLVYAYTYGPSGGAFQVNSTVSKSPVGASNFNQIQGSGTSAVRAVYIFNPSSEATADGEALVSRSSGTSAISEGTLQGGAIGSYILSTTSPGAGPNPDNAQLLSSGEAANSAFIYGVFAEDPGYIEEFELV